MKVELLIPDIATPEVEPQTTADAASFSKAYEQVASLLDHAQESERNFVNGQGSLLDMTTARARADIALSTAVAVASRLSQCASTLGNMSL